LSKALSIIIVIYRSWNVLTACLESFERFPPQLDYEIIIVDNDSQDGLLSATSQKFPQHQFVSNKGNYGFSSGCNFGAQLARGEYLLFLNPDTLLTENGTLEALLEFARSHPDVGISSCRRIDTNGRHEREIAFLNPWLMIGWIRTIYKIYKHHYLTTAFSQDKQICYPEWVSGAVILINISLFNNIGGWSEDDFWMYFEDPDLCLRLRKAGKKTALLRTAQLTHAHGGSSRQNTTTTAITKAAVTTSFHTYINKHTQGINRISLHTAVIISTSIGQLVKIILSIISLRKKKISMQILLLKELVKYYRSALTKKSWNSRRLKQHES